MRIHKKIDEAGEGLHQFAIGQAPVRDRVDDFRIEVDEVRGDLLGGEAVVIGARTAGQERVEGAEDLGPWLADGFEQEIKNTAQLWLLGICQCVKDGGLCEQVIGSVRVRAEMNDAGAPLMRMVFGHVAFFPRWGVARGYFKIDLRSHEWRGRSLRCRNRSGDGA